MCDEIMSDETAWEDHLEYIRLIKKEVSRISSSFQRQYTYEDLMQEGLIVYYKARKKYNPEKGKFSTYFIRSLQKTFLVLLYRKELEMCTTAEIETYIKTTEEEIANGSKKPSVPHFAYESTYDDNNCQDIPPFFNMPAMFLPFGKKNDALLNRLRPYIYGEKRFNFHLYGEAKKLKEHILVPY